jgi:hypothetical protein
MYVIREGNVRVCCELWLEVHEQAPVDEPRALLQLMQRILEGLQKELVFTCGNCAHARAKQVHNRMVKYMQKKEKRSLATCMCVTSCVLS